MNILITGGSKGLGRAIVSQLAANPANHVYFTYSRSEAPADELIALHANTSKIHCDFSDENSIAALTDNIAALNIDVLINNAAANYAKSHFHKLAIQQFIDSFKINITATVAITQAAIKAFRKKKSGRIITILSSAIIGKAPIGWAEYVANKNYLLSLSKSWATENNRFNIVSNCVSPSFMLTDFNQEVDERVIEDIIAAHPLGKLLTTNEVADTVNFLTSCSQHINGVNIVMNAAMDI